MKTFSPSRISQQTLLGVALLLLLSLTAHAPRARAEAPDYSAIDAYALAAPPAAAQSVAALAAYFTAGAKTDREKARAIFRWMAENISYDDDGVASGHIEQDPAAVLKRRVAECGGYAFLYQALAKASGLDAQAVFGVMKNFDNPDKVVEFPAHGWDAVKIDGQYQLVDATWGAFHALRGGQTVTLHAFSPEWFCTAPDQFLPFHFPDDAKWQLTAAPITRAEFEKMPGLSVAASGYGIKPVSHPDCAFGAGSSLTVTLAVPPGTHLSAELREKGQALGDQYVFSQRDQGNYAVSVAFPHAGDYNLRLFARRDGETTYAPVVDYAVTASAGADIAAFPKVFSRFRDCEAEVVEPSGGALTAGTSQNFRLDVPGASEVWVQTGTQKTKLTQQGDWFSGPVTLVAGDVTLWSRFPDKPAALQGLLKYTAH